MRLNKSFLELYRPKQKEDIVGNKIIIERIFSQLYDKRLPNMILTGDAGIGKTSTAEVLAKEILGEKYYYEDCIIINCSDKTGVDFIRTEIIDTCSLKPLGKLRIWILEESEQLSKSAQKAMKKPLETPFDKSNRFIYLSNDLSKFIKPIVDRCRVYQFMPIKPEEMIDRLKFIRDEQKINISDDLLEYLSEISNGSMRYPIIQLEEFKSLNRKITKNDLRLEKSLEVIKEIFSLLKDRKIPIAKNKVLELYQKGFYFKDIARYFHDFTMLSLGNDLNYEVKAKTLIKIAESERDVNNGCNQFIVVSSLLSNISLLLQKTNNGD